MRPGGGAGPAAGDSDPSEPPKPRGVGLTVPPAATPAPTIAQLAPCQRGPPRARCRWPRGLALQASVRRGGAAADAPGEPPARGGAEEEDPAAPTARGPPQPPQ